MSLLRPAPAALSLILAAVTAAADDRVWLEPPRPTSSQGTWYPRAIQQLSGRVVQLDATQLRFVRSGDEAETVIAARRVLWIRPDPVTPLQAEAIELFADGKYAESLAKLPGILKQRPPVWRQQWITMLAAQAAWKSRRSKIALELVSQLDRLPLPPVAIAWLPVAWQDGVQSADAVTQAKARLSDPSPAVRLVAASWLLSSPDRRQAAGALKQLSTHDRPEIQQLADVLLWRTATPPQVIESAEQWQAKLDQLPMVLQVGPTKTLVNKLQSAGQTAAANQLQWSLDLTPIHPAPE